MNNEAGFTLIEMLVALALTAMIAVAGTALLTSSLRASGRLNEVAESTWNADLSHTLMRDDFANIVDDPASFAQDPRGDAAVLLSLKRRTTRVPVDAVSWPGSVRIDYRYLQGNLVRRIWSDAVQSNDQPAFADRTLATGLEGLRLTFFDGSDWRPEWRAGQEHLPRAIAFRLEYGDSDTLTQYFLVGGGG